MTRREMLARTGQVGTALSAGLPAANAASQNHPQIQPPAGRKLKILVAGGHPGDPEYGCGGTIARYTDLGHEVVLLYLTNGEWPPAQGGAPAHIRVGAT